MHAFEICSLFLIYTRHSANTRCSDLVESSSENWRILAGKIGEAPTKTEDKDIHTKQISIPEPDKTNIKLTESW